MKITHTDIYTYMLLKFTITYWQFKTWRQQDN